MNEKKPSYLRSFMLNGQGLSSRSINTIRVALGLAGVAALVFGILMVFWTKQSAEVLSILIGLYLLIAGAAHLIGTLVTKGIGGGTRALGVILGAVQLIVGIIVLFNVQASALVFGVFLGIFIGVLWIVEGVITLANSGDSASRVWSILYGVLALIAGIVMLFSPVWAAVAVFWFIGISLIVLGIAQIVRAFRFGAHAN